MHVHGRKESREIGGRLGRMGWDGMEQRAEIKPSLAVRGEEAKSGSCSCTIKGIKGCY